MSGGIYSTYQIRVRAVRAVIQEQLPVTVVAQAYGTDRSTVDRWISRYEAAEGEEGLLRRPVSGRPRKLEALDRERLWEMVLSPASAYAYETDFWTTLRLRQVTASEFGVVVSRQTILRRLPDAGLSYQKPAREYFELSQEEREQWRRSELPKIRAALRKYRAILYFQDEANISLTALLAKTWAAGGKTPKQTVTGQRGSVSAMSAITSRGRLLFRLHEKRITSAEVIDFLVQMLRHHKGRHLLVVMDQAPPQTSKKTDAFINSQQRLHVFHLPKYSPDWNPDEKAWNQLKHQELKGHQARTKAQLRQLAHDTLKKLSKDPHLLRGIFFRCCVAELLE